MSEVFCSEGSVQRQERMCFPVCISDMTIRIFPRRLAVHPQDRLRMFHPQGRKDSASGVLPEVVINEDFVQVNQKDVEKYTSSLNLGN